MVSKTDEVSKTAEVTFHAPRPVTPEAPSASHVPSPMPDPRSNDDESTMVETIQEMESTHGDNDKERTKFDSKAYSPLHKNRILQALTVIKALSSPSVKSFVQDFGIERHGHQLPPPFYPAPPQQSVEPTTLSELEEDTTRSQTSVLFPHQLEHNIMFGGYPESDHSSPTIPLSAGSNGFPQPTPPSEITSSPTQSEYQGYGHASDVIGSSVSQDTISAPYYFTSGEQIYIPGQYDYDGIPIRYKHSITFDRAPQTLFTPSATPFSDQATQTHSPTSTRLPSERFELIQPLEFPENQLSDQLFHNSFLSHLFAHFDSQEYADCELNIQIRDSSTTLMLHSLLIGQSTTLRNLIKSGSRASRDGRTVLSLQSDNEYVTVPAIKAALQLCYGVPAIDAFKSYMPGLTDTSGEIDMPRYKAAAESQMDATLAFTAAGHILDLWNVSHYGALNVAMYISLETLEKILKFSLDGLTRLKDTIKLERLINAIADHNLDYDGGGTYSPYSNHILQNALVYIVANVSDYFILDIHAPTYPTLSPFPAISTPNSTRSSSRSGLNCIQFGDFPSENVETPTKEDTLLSSCLLSIPFVLLKHILDRLDQTVSQRVSKPIVSERERRRLANVKIWTQLETYSEHDFPELSHWEEFICSDNSYCTVERRWTAL